jgi:hypothetical protein
MRPTFHRVEWIHDFEGEPYLHYYDQDSERYATRKIELFPKMAGRVLIDLHRLWKR